MVSAISVRLLTLNPARYITPKVPTSESGTAMLGNERTSGRAQEKEYDHDH